MEKQGTKRNDSNIFSEIDMDLIAEKIDKNLEILEDYTDYNILNHRKTELELKLFSYFDESQSQLLKKYLMILTDSIKYQNALAYYLGMKAMKEIEKLK